MVTLEIEFLTGRYVATAHDDRSTGEWPPHPARVFSALVAAWADEQDPLERTALQWMERQAPPAIAAGEAASRLPVTHYVPVNDTDLVSPSWYARRAADVEATVAGLEEALAHAAGDLDDRKVVRALSKLEKLRDVGDKVQPGNGGGTSGPIPLVPWTRVHQPRTFPSVTPDPPLVTYLWDADPDADVRGALDRLAGRVSRIGHSSSLVSCRLVPDAPAPDLVPDPDGALSLRGVAPGQLEALEAAFAQHKGSRPRSLPFRLVRYGRASVPVVDPGPAEPTISGDWFVFEFAPEGRRLPMTRAVAVARALRGAMIQHAPDPRDEALSGHREDGRPTALPHMAFVPLPFVGSDRADGRIVGCAVLLPGTIAPEARRNALAAIGHWEASEGGSVLRLGRAGVISCRRIIGPTTLASLRRGVWDGPSTTWSSVTPVALPNHPGPLFEGSPARRARSWSRAEELIALSCRHAGLPDPLSVMVSPSPLVDGSSPAGSFPAFRQPGPSGAASVPRVLLHAAVEFGRPVRGPLLIGAGRYFGLGLMRPMEAA